MIPLVSTTPPAAAPHARGWSLSALLRDMVNTWLAHHQRLADLGLCGQL